MAGSELRSPDISEEQSELGLTSLVLGSVGTLLFFLPILGIPLASLGLLVGLLGMVLALCGRAVNLRWSTAGFIASLIGLSLNCAMAWAPLDPAPRSSKQPMSQPVPERPSVSPPARSA